MIVERIRGVRAAGRRALLLAGVASLGAGTTACRLVDDALSVDTPTQVPASLLEEPQHARLLVNGLIGDFDCALGAYIVTAGLLGDELHDGTFTAANWPVASRTLSGTENYGTLGCTGRGLYTPLSVARWSADDALRKLEGWTDEQVTPVPPASPATQQSVRAQLIATAAAYSGYAHVLLGEGMCTLAFDAGPEVQPAEAFTRAEERFTRAIAAATAANDPAILNMARVGRARARLNLGRKAEAAADAALVPAGFVRGSTRNDSDARSRNRVALESPWSNGSGTAAGSTSVKEPYHNVRIDGVADPRVEVTNLNRLAGDAITPLWRQDKYRGPAVSTPIARYAEARLIMAEAQGGQQAVTIINALRAPHALPAFAATNEAAIQAQVVEERRRELFLEGHRLGDMRRYALPLFPATGTAYNKGGSYGPANCFPLPAVERNNNPNIS